MKKSISISAVVALLIGMNVIVGCGGDSSTPSGNSAGDAGAQKSTIFLDFYHPDDGSKTLKSIILGEGGDVKTQTITNQIYPPQGYGGRWYTLKEAADANKQYCIMDLHKDFNEGRSNYAALINLLSGVYEKLPLPPARNDSHFSYYQEGSGKVGQAHVFYIASDTHKAYGDDTRSAFLRYDINRKNYTQAKACDSFIVGQPEKKADTEACLRSSLFIPSADDRYIYGAMTGWGVDGGQNHYDYTILYQYDFDTSTYTRLGEDSDVGFAGATSDAKHLLYTDHDAYKVYSVDSSTVKTLHNISYIGNPSRSQWNQSGYLNGPNYYNILADSKTEVIANNTNNIKTSQFAPDGNSIYFVLKSEPTVVYQTDDLSAGSQYHKVMNITADDDLLVLKGVTALPTGSSSSTTSSVSSQSSSSTPSVANGKSCIWDDGVFLNCIDNLPAEECTLQKRDPWGEDDYSSETIYMSPDSCTENGFEDYIENDDGTKEYYKTTV